jgi:hypothetical protein
MRANGKPKAGGNSYNGNQEYEANSPALLYSRIGAFKGSRSNPLFTHVYISRLIMDGALRLKRVVRKTSVPFDVINAQGSTSTIQVECLAPELTTRPLMGILCNDLLVLCRDPSEGRDPTSSVDLWAVLRMQTQHQPASIVHGNGMMIFS